MAIRGRRKQETIREHETGIEIVLYLWTEKLEWEAVVGAHSWRNKDGKKAIASAKEWVRANMHPVYKPVIRVDELAPFCGTPGQFVGFEVDRFWVTMLADGECRKVRWNLYDPDDPEGKSRHLLRRDDSMQHIPLNDLPYVTDDFADRTKEYYLDYTPELWQGLRNLLDAIGAVRKHLNDLIAHDHAALIAGAGLLALPKETGE